MHRTIEGDIKTATVKREGDEWYIIFSCEVEQPDPLPEVQSEIGIDVGITHLAALSDGTFIDSPRFLRQAQKDLKQKQRHVSRCKRGSHRRDKARQQVRKAHRKVENQRRDFHFKEAKKLIEQHNAAMNIHLAWKMPTYWNTVCGAARQCVEAPCL